MNDFPEDCWRSYDELQQTFLADGSCLLTEEKYLWRGMIAAQHWLIFPTGTPVAFLQTLFTPSADEPLMLSTIEVRPAYRGAGLTREIVRAVEDFYGLRLYTSGSFTELGLAALSWLPLAADKSASLAYAPMNFVKHWELLIPAHGL